VEVDQKAQASRLDQLGVRQDLRLVVVSAGRIVPGAEANVIDADGLEDIQRVPRGPGRVKEPAAQILRALGRRDVGAEHGEWGRIRGGYADRER
jgi:hypothetical protein